MVQPQEQHITLLGLVDTTYSFSVKAIDTVGNVSTASLALTVTTLKSSDKIGNDFSTAYILQVGNQVSDAIDYSGDVDFFKFTPTYSGTYTMATSGSTDTYGYLYDASLSQLAYNDDSNGTTNFSISYSLTAN